MSTQPKFRIVGELGIECSGRIIATCSSAADAAVVLTSLVGGKVRAPRKTAKGKWHWPPPVYVATYADGHCARMSFTAQYGKPVDIDAARLQAVQHRAVKIHGNPEYPFGIPTGEYVPMVSFRVEHDGRVVGEDMQQVAA
jgi:hypothetical protein